MSTNYTREIVVSNTPAAAFQALTSEFHKWWTTNCNPVSATGDQITFRFGVSYWVMRVVSLIPNRSVVLECIEAHHMHEGLSSSILNEWQGTKLIWEIQKQGEKTSITLVHDGLVPTLDCYEVCKQGWDHFVVDSLKQYLDTGKGSPFED